MTNFELYTYLQARKGAGGEPVAAANPALRLMDWEGTVLKEYTAEQAASLTALPNPSSLNTNADRDLLTFQGYNWALADIKAWVTAHEGQCLTVGAIYTTTDGQDHNFWDNPAFDTLRFAIVQKRGTTSIESSAFTYCTSLENINIPGSVTRIGQNAFAYCASLENINIPDSVTSIGNNAFQSCTSLNGIVIQGKPELSNVNAFDGIYSGCLIYVPRAKLSWYSTATNWTTLYNNNKIAAIEDNIEYLESIGIDV